MSPGARAASGQRGLLHPVVLDADGWILDGRNRYATCELARVEPRFETYDGDDPAGYALAANIQRRNLTKGQQAMTPRSPSSSVSAAGDEPDQVAMSTVLLTAELLEAAFPGWTVRPGLMWSAHWESADRWTTRDVMAPTADQLASRLQAIAEEA